MQCTNNEEENIDRKRENLNKGTGGDIQWKRQSDQHKRALEGEADDDAVRRENTDAPGTDQLVNDTKHSNAPSFELRVSQKWKQWNKNVPKQIKTYFKVALHNAIMA